MGVGWGSANFPNLRIRVGLVSGNFPNLRIRVRFGLPGWWGLGGGSANFPYPGFRVGFGNINKKEGAGISVQSTPVVQLGAPVRTGFT